MSLIGIHLHTFIMPSNNAIFRYLSGLLISIVTLMTFTLVSLWATTTFSDTKNYSKYLSEMEFRKPEDANYISAPYRVPIWKCILETQLSQISTVIGKVQKKRTDEVVTVLKSCTSHALTGYFQLSPASLFYDFSADVPAKLVFFNLAGVRTE